MALVAVQQRLKSGRADRSEPRGVVDQKSETGGAYVYRLHRILRTTLLTVAAFGGLIVPLLVGMIGYHFRTTEASVLLDVKADDVSRLIGLYPNTWHLLHERLIDRLQSHTYADVFHSQIFDTADTLLAQTNHVQRWPTIVYTTPLSDGWDRVGTLRLVADLSDVVFATGCSFLGGLVLTAGLFFIFQFSVSRLMDQLVAAQTAAISHYSLSLENAIRERERVTITRDDLQLILSSMQDPVVVMTDRGDVVSANRAAVVFFKGDLGFAHMDDAISCILDGLPDQIVEKVGVHGRVTMLQSDHFTTGIAIKGVNAECRNLLLSGGRIISPSIDESTDQVNRFVICVRDVTPLEHARQSLEQSLREKETLIKEIHHRVKNNLQVVVGLLQMQARRAADGTVKEQLLSADQRVMCIAMVHELLCEGPSLDRIPMHPFVERLTKQIRFMHSSVQDIDVVMDVDNLEFSPDLAIPIGQIITETVSNAFKHAFSIGHHGRVNILLRCDPEDPESVVLSVIDDGVGLCGAADLPHGGNLGMRVVRLLAQNMDAVIDYASDGPGLGTRFTMRFSGASHA